MILKSTQLNSTQFDSTHLESSFKPSIPRIYKASQLACKAALGRIGGGSAESDAASETLPKEAASNKPPL